LKFFFDNNLSPYLAEAIHLLSSQDGHEVVHMRDKFPHNPPDSEWIAQLGDERGWIIISGDVNILKNSHEREVWKQAKLTTFVFGKSFMNKKNWEQIWIVFRWWPEIVDMAERVAAGAAYQVPLSYGQRRGKLKQLL